MISKVISGGQTGVDQAALRAARRAGIPTGGLVPRGWRTEDGPAPWLDEYGLEEVAEYGYVARTKANIDAATMTLVLLGHESDRRGGTGITLAYCQELATDPGVCKPFTEVLIGHEGSLANALLGLRLHFEHDDGVLNVAGPRESRRPGIGQAAEEFLCNLFGQLGYAIKPAEAGRLSV